MKNQYLLYTFCIGSFLIGTVFLTSCNPNNVISNNNDSQPKSSNNNTLLKSSSLSKLPKEAEDAVIKLEQARCAKDHNWECKNFKVTCAIPLDLTAADEANGATERWCINLEYISRSNANEEWSDRSNGYAPDAEIWTNPNEKWERYSSGAVYRCRCGE